MCQFPVGQLVYITAEKDIVGQDPDLTTDFAGYNIVVASQNFDADPRLGQCGNRGPSALLGRIEEGNIAE